MTVLDAAFARSKSGSRRGPAGSGGGGRRGGVGSPGTLSRRLASVALLADSRMRLRRNPRRLLAPSMDPNVPHRRFHPDRVKPDHPPCAMMDAISTPTDTRKGSTGTTKPSGSRKDRSRLIAAAILGGLAVVFAVINRHEVKVNWLLGTWETPLIVVIGVSFLAGAAIGAFASRRRYRGGKKTPAG